MIKQNIQYLLLIGILFCCETQNKNMDIRTTSINDYETTYIFNLENDINTLKKINNYAIKEIKAQKHFIDSLKNIAPKNATPKTFEEYLNSTTLALTPEDVIFYTPPIELMDRVRKKDMVLHYILSTENATIKKIIVGNRYKNVNSSIKVIANNNNCTLIVDQQDFALETLHSILNKTEQLKYQNKYSDFIYNVKNKDSVSILDIVYKHNGKSLLLNYN